MDKLKFDILGCGLIYYLFIYLFLLMKHFTNFAFLLLDKYKFVKECDV
jgi:hypothetical protein